MTAPTLDTAPIDAYACTVNGLTAFTADGRTATLDRCCWYEVAPCGCVSGMIVTVIGDKVLMTADAALREMSDSVKDYRETVKRGGRMVLVHPDDWRGAAGDLMTGKCPHTPRFGITRKTREVDGITWTRITSDRWDCTYLDKGWSLSKWSKRWNLSGPFQGDGKYRPPYLGGVLTDALAKASAYALAHPDGLERIA